MSKISGWAEAVSANDNPTQDLSEAIPEAVESEEVCEEISKEWISLGAADVSDEVSDVEPNEDENFISHEVVSEDTIPTLKERLLRASRPEQKTFGYEDRIIDEIDALSLKFTQGGEQQYFYDISDFECEGIALLIEYASSKEDIDLFPIVQAFMEIKRRQPAEEALPAGVSLQECKSPNFDALFARVKSVLLKNN